MKHLLAALCLTAVPAAASSPDLEAALAQATTSASEARAGADAVDGPLTALGNFHEVAPGLYRSAQPSREGYKRLKEFGVRTLLSLKDNPERERAEAGAEGLLVENVPMDGFSQPSFEQVDRALLILTDPSKRPLLVHCQYGKDRTGFVVAAYRVVVEHADEARAAEEAKSYGCCFAPFGDLAKFLKRYSAHRRALPAGA